MTIPSTPELSRGISPALLVVLGGLLLLFGAETALILWRNGGLLTYTLDDPYIHLALAENIWRGHYGVNMEEVSAPSSSILWPLLLAPLAGTGLGIWWPLVINLALSVASVWQVSLLLERVMGWSGQVLPRLLHGGLLGFFVLSTNMLGLAFTGMEHSLQLYCVVLTAWGLVEELETGKVSRTLMAALVMAPLVRYESLAVVAGGLLYLFARGHRGRAVGLGLVVLMLLGAFSGFLVSLGLSPFPTSVMAKSAVVESGGKAGSIFGNLKQNLGSDRGMLLVISGLVLAAYGLWEQAGRRWLALGGGVAIVLHLMVGRYGWFNRYEIYIWAFVQLCLWVLVAPRLARLLAERSLREQVWKVLGLSGLALGALCMHYVYALALIPGAASNVYEQHYQMHRFATQFYGKPVALNDLGYVAYQNPACVLDLHGLASLEALKMRKTRTDGDWIPPLTERYGVKLAMVYDAWFVGRIPGSWIKLGELKLGRARVTISEDAVAFYALSPEEVPVAQAALEKFSTSLPPGVHFVMAAGEKKGETLGE
ncbi:MAG: hypothetical protein ACKO6N_28025 [Myxococcota bacterium]